MSELCGLFLFVHRSIGGFVAQHTDTHPFSRSTVPQRTLRRGHLHRRSARDADAEVRVRAHCRRQKVRRAEVPALHCKHHQGCSCFRLALSCFHTLCFRCFCFCFRFALLVCVHTQACGLQGLRPLEWLFAPLRFVSKAFAFVAIAQQHSG